MKLRLTEIEVPAENPFAQDALDRKPVVEVLAGLIDTFPGPFVMALDSPWGTGKTTLVRLLKAKLEQSEYCCIYFNAWQSDFATDPLVAMVSAISAIDIVEGEAKSRFAEHMSSARRLTSVVAKRGAVAAAKALTLGALDLDKEIEAAAAEMAGNATTDLIGEFQREQAALDRLRATLEEAVGELEKSGKRSKLIFFVDELDRCRPTFAIETLERIKHLFDLSNIVFILSVDKAQLEASVGAVYGERSNALEYLRRFFDLEFGIPQCDAKRFTGVLLTRFGLDDLFANRTGNEVAYDKDNFVEYFSALADLFSLSLRARERCVTLLGVVLHQTPSDHYLDPILVAFLLVLRTKRPDLFGALYRGSLSAQDAMSVISELPGGKKFVADHPGILIESYLLAGDPDQDRVNAHYEMLSNIWTSNEGTPAERARIKEMLQFRGKIVSARRYRFSYRIATGKIDIAASIRN